jgi:hypothetical protein
MAVMPINEKPTKLIMLPNNDMWRGRPQDEIVERPDTVDASAPATPEDAVIEMLQSQRGETITCHWCGEQFTRKQFNELTDHVTKLHPSALKPLPTLTAAEAFDLSNAQIVGKIVADTPF